MSASTDRDWSAARREAGESVEAIAREASGRHSAGSGPQTHYLCARGVTRAVAERRRKIEEILVDEAGGECVSCGDRACIGVLRFHHLDPSTKRFHLGRDGATRSIEAARAEARRCVLLCANCPAEVELGVRVLPVTSGDAPPVRGGADDGPG